LQIQSNQSDFSFLNVPLNANGEPQKDPEKALMANQLIKDRLVRLRQLLMEMIQKIDVQFNINKAFLERAKSSGTKDANSFKTTYIKCGAPFFKDAHGDPAPINEEYKQRKSTEFFPYEMPYTSPRWKTREKIALINGVKNQMVDFIKTQQSKKICLEAKRTRSKMQKLKFISTSQDLQSTPIFNIYSTIQSDYPEFTINWGLISFNDLHSTHSEFECAGMWNSYLRPDINREPFTLEEANLLINAALENENCDWEAIASLLNNRSALQTFIHYFTSLTRLCPGNIRWAPDEDEKLMQLTEKHSYGGVINWTKVGQVMESRNKTQCYNRYLIISKQNNSKKGTFTLQENRKILEYVKLYGEDFSKLLPEILPGRSTVQIKTHYNVALKHKGNVFPWTREEDKLLMDFVEKEGTNKWFQIADTLETHNRLSCRTRYLTITKFLKKNPNSTLEEVPSKLKAITAASKALKKESSDADDGGDNDEGDVNQQAPGTSMARLSGIPVEIFKSRNRDLYNLLRTSYNYDLSNREVKASNIHILLLKELLQIDDSAMKGRRVQMFTKNQLSKLNEALETKMDRHLMSEIKFATKHTQFLLPPSYSTIIGLRAVAIKIHEDPLPVKVTSESINMSPAYHKALEDFQKFFFSIFYWPAMLSKLDTDELNKMHFLKDSNQHAARNDVVRVLNKRKLAMHYVFQPQKGGHIPPVTNRTSGRFLTYPPAKRHRPINETEKNVEDETEADK